MNDLGWLFQWIASADAPDTSSDLEQFLHVNGVAEEPGENGTAATTQPEPTGEVSPTGAGEQVGGGILNRHICRGDVGLLAGLVVEQEQQAEDVHGADGSQQPSGLLVFRGTQGTTDGEGAVEQITEGCTGFQTPEVRRNSRAVQGQVVDQTLDEIAAVDGCRKVADAGISSRSDGHEVRVLRG